MKFIIVALLVGACLTGVSWPSASATKTLGSPMTIKAGQTYDGKASNGGKWVRFERGRSGLGDCTKVEGGKADAVFLLEKGATLKNVILGAKSVEHVVLFILKISIVKIQENFTELAETAKKDIKEKELFL